MKRNSIEKVCILIVATLLAGIFSGVHTFFCFFLGVFWASYLYGNDDPRDHVLFGKWKMSYNRYSFVKFIKNVDKKLNEHFNQKQSAQTSSLLRILTPTLFFATLNGLLPFHIEWYFILGGALIFELVYVHSRRV